jgi:hypothetical protein
VDCGHPSAQTESGMTDECSLTEKGHGQRMIYKLTERGEHPMVHRGKQLTE